MSENKAVASENKCHQHVSIILFFSQPPHRSSLAPLGVVSSWSRGAQPSSRVQATIDTCPYAAGREHPLTWRAQPASNTPISSSFMSCRSFVHSLQPQFHANCISLLLPLSLIIARRLFA